MNFKCNTDVMLDLLNNVMPIIAPKSTILVLQYLSFDLEGNLLTVIATSEDLTIKTSIEVMGTEDGKILVPAKKYSDIIRSFGKSGEITFNTDQDNQEIQINYGKGKYRFSGLDWEEFIQTDHLFGASPMDSTNAEEDAAEELKATFIKGELSRIAERNLFAVSTEEYNLAMTGVLFQFRLNKLTSVSSDGFRLNRFVMNKEENLFPEQYDVIIPSKSMEFLKKIESDCDMTVIRQDKAPKYLKFSYDDTIFTTRIITDKFPAYETIIPDSFSYTAYAPLNELLSATKRVSIFSNPDNKLLILKFTSDSLTLVAENEQTAENASEIVNCEFTGDEFEIGVRYDYFTQSIQHINYENPENQGIVEMKLNDPNKAYIIIPKEEGERFLMLNMPVRFK
jgi:DNA polymerase-3 subunit beta